MSSGRSSPRAPLNELRARHRATTALLAWLLRSSAPGSTCPSWWKSSSPPASFCPSRAPAGASGRASSGFSSRICRSSGAAVEDDDRAIFGEGGGDRRILDRLGASRARGRGARGGEAAARARRLCADPRRLRAVFSTTPGRCRPCACFRGFSSTAWPVAQRSSFRSGLRSSPSEGARRLSPWLASGGAGQKRLASLAAVETVYRLRRLSLRRLPSRSVVLGVHAGGSGGAGRGRARLAVLHRGRKRRRDVRSLPVLRAHVHDVRLPPLPQKGHSGAPAPA